MQFGFQLPKKNIQNPDPNGLSRIYVARYTDADFERLGELLTTSIGGAYTGIEVNDLPQDHDLNINCEDPINDAARDALMATIDATMNAWQLEIDAV